MTDKDSLWAKVIRCKYKCGNDIVPNIMPKHNASNFWRGIVNIRDQFNDGIIWRVNNGELVRFWRDRWIPGIDCLENHVNVSLSHEEREAKVATFIGDHGYWDVQRFCHFLPKEIVLKIISMQPPLSNASHDIPAWRHSNDGLFSVNSAYDSLLNHASSFPEDPLWKLIWRWDGPPKIRSFLWLSSLDKLTTMNTLSQRKIVVSALCPMGCHTHENVLHVLRDCNLARSF